MKFIETPLRDAYVIEIEPHRDERGFFARSWCTREFRERGLNARLVQCNVSFNQRKGVLRGMHYQADPFPEAKLVRCTRGRIFDVIVDLRPESVSFRKWYGIELAEGGIEMVYVPEGFAHGFQTLEDNTELLYLMSEFYHPECSRGVRWDDPAISIQWPIPDPIVSDKDRSYEYLDKQNSIKQARPKAEAPLFL